MPTVPRTIGVRELKARTSAVLREVQATSTEIIVTLRGRPIARIEPITGVGAAPVDGMGGLKGALAHLGTLEWEDFQEAKRLWDPKPLPEDSP